MKWLLALSALLATPVIAAPPASDAIPRIAIVSAFPPEISALAAEVADPQSKTINGTRFTTGTIAGKPVLLFLSGISMVNAAMTTQLALDHFPIARIVFSGIAGGIDPALSIGDVVVPDRWAQYLESTFARTDGKGGYAPAPGHAVPGLANYGMIYPRAIEIMHGEAEPERRVWFPVDPAMLAVARQVAATTVLQRCLKTLCLVKPPRVIAGGNGISGPVFMDNADYRSYAFNTFHAQVLDMESAAVAQVAYVSGTPFIAFRSLSDLAGGDAGANQMTTFFGVAAANSATVVTAFLKALPPESAQTDSQSVPPPAPAASVRP